MALLVTKPYDPVAQTAWVNDAIQLAAQMQQRQAELAAAERQKSAALVQASIQDTRRAFEFERRMEFDRARTAADDRRQDDRLSWEKQQVAEGNMPFDMGGPAVAPSATVRVPQVQPPMPSVTATASPKPNFSISATTQPEETPFSMPDEIAPAPSQAVVDGMPAPDAAAPSAEVLPPDDPTASRVKSALTAMKAAGVPITKKMAQAALPSMISSAFAAEGRQAAKATGSATTEAMGKWPINEQGLRFNPDAPDQMFEERHTTRGATFKQVKQTDPWYGLAPEGDGLYADKNGQRFFVEKIANGKPTLKRVEEEAEVKFRTTDSEGKIHSFNQYGAEVAITPNTVSFLKPKSRPMVGSDGNVYAWDGVANSWATPPPAGVTFDGGKNAEAKTFRVGNDGKMYAFKRDGSPIIPVPEGVKLMAPRDEKAVSHWETDEKTGDLHGFNYVGEKIAETEGDYAKIRKVDDDTPTLQDVAMFETLAPKVKGMWQVYDQIRALGLDPNASHQDLVARLGNQGASLSAARLRAQDDVRNLKVKGRSISRDAAEGFVRAYEARGAAKPATTAPPAAAATPPATAPAATVWKVDKNGVKWEYDATTKQPTGKYVKPPA